MASQRLKKTTKKSSGRKRADLHNKSKAKDVGSSELMNQQAQDEVGPLLKKKFSFKYLLLVVFVVIVASLLYYYKGLFIAGSVNKQLIFRTSVIGELEKTQGKRALDNLVTRVLIYQEAKKQGINVSDSDIDQKLIQIDENLKKQGQSLDAALAIQGMQKEDFREQVKIQLNAEKILADKISISESEVSDYIKDNKDFLPGEITGEDLNTFVEDQLRGQKLSAEFQTWLTEVKKNAKIDLYINY